MMETTLRQFGNSLGFVIPKVLRESLALSAGQTVQLVQTEQGLLLKPAKTKYSLKDLIAQCDINTPMPNDLNDWENLPSVGNEVW
jgi:antitoxin component of MazEF toxin-antitoxin module